jgi:hypothetical protein
MKEAKITFTNGKELSTPYEVALSIRTKLNAGTDQFLCINDRNENLLYIINLTDISYIKII